MRIPTTSDVYMDLGTSVHNMIQETVSKTTKIPSRAEAMKKMKEKWIFRYYPNQGSENKFWDRAKKMTDIYLKWRKSNKNKFVASEEYLYFKYAGITLNGKIDWIEQDANGEYEIVDFKTGGAVSQEMAEKDVQLHLYAKLIEMTKEYGKLPTKATLYFLDDSTTGGIKRTVKIDKKKVADILDKELKPLIEKILKEEKFEAKPGKACYRCGYKPICDAYQKHFKV